MALKLMYITNNPQIALIAEKYSVDRIWVDLEKRGKRERQEGRNTVQSTHTIDDVQRIRSVVSSSELVVRINPLFEGSAEEIDEVIRMGADIIMLPFFQTVSQVDHFLELVNGRCKTMLLVETIAAEENLDNILKLRGIDEIHIGLNDLHIQYNLKFMFELLANGTVERICEKIKKYDIPYGFGGIAKLDEGMLPARHIIAEHYRLGSSGAILSRSFYDSWISEDIQEVERTFKFGLGEIREYEERLNRETSFFFEENRKKVYDEVQTIVSKMKKI